MEIPPKLIHPQGPESARLMLVIDSPTEDDTKNAKLFSGSYSNLIRNFLKPYKDIIPYEQTYRTALIKERLSYNGPNRKLQKEAINLANTHRNYPDIFLKEILAISPAVITPLGEITFGYLTGEKSITNFRGSVLPLREEFTSRYPALQKIKIIPSLPTRDIYADKASEVYVGLDYKRISSILDGSYIKEPTEVLIPHTIGEALEFFNRYFRPEIGVFDIETRYSIPVCIGFAFDRSKAITIPLLDSKYDKETLVRFWNIVDTVLRKGNWVNQNIKFDIHRLRWFGFADPNVLGDTAIRSSVIYPEFEKKLAFLNSIYTDMPYFKGEGKDAGGDRNRLYTYCGKDCISTFRIYEEQEKDLKDQGLQDFERKVQSLFWPYIRIERRGIRIDDLQRIKLLAKYWTHFNVYRGVLGRLTGNKNFNPQSSDQCKKLLYDEFGLPPQIDKKTGNQTTDEEALLHLLAFFCNDDIHKFQVLSLIIGCRKLHKVIEAIETPTHPDQRMRCSYDLGGTKNGRTAAKKCAESILYIDYSTKIPSYKFTDVGHSLQTFGKHEFYILGESYGKDLRSMFIPTPGYIFCEGDLSQAEARVDCVLAEDWNFLPEFDKKPGVHCLTGSWVYSCDPGDIQKGTEKYHIAKTVRHAGERNMLPPRLAAMIQKDNIFCTELLNKFHDRQPKIRGVFHAGVRDFVLNNRYLISPHGRRRDFFDRPGFEMYNEAISTLPQMIVSDQIKFSIPMLEEKLAHLDFFFIYEGHDALMVEIKKEHMEEYSNAFHTIVERPIDFRSCSLPRDIDLVIPAELEWSENNWGDLKKI